MSFRSDRKKSSRFATVVENSNSSWQSAAKLPPDLDRCPAGWDEDVWHLVLLFEQKAREDGISLNLGRPLAYSRLVQCLDRAEGFRSTPVPWSEAKLDLAFEFLCWCNYAGERPHQLIEMRAYPLSGPRWRRVVELMVTEFWTRYWNEYAWEDFTSIDGQYGFKYQFDKLNERMSAPDFRQAWREKRELVR